LIGRIATVRIGPNAIPVLLAVNTVVPRGVAG